MSAEAKTVIEVFEHSVKEYKNNRAFTCLDHTITYAELDDLSARFAAWLQNHTDLKPGDRIAIQLPNILQYPIALFGSIRAGLVVVNTNPLYTPREVKHQLNDSGAKALVILANVAEGAASIIKETNVAYTIVTEVADVHPPLKKFLINNVVKYIKKEIPPYNFPNQFSFSQVIKSPLTPLRPVEHVPENVVVLQYTGGTTGVAKGAMLTNANLVANKNQLLERQKDLIKEGGDTYVAPLPLYHIYAFTAHCMSILGHGNHNLLIPNPRDIKGFVKTLEKHKVYGFVGLNTLFNSLCNTPEFRALDFSNMAMTASGGMALTSDTSKRWTEITGVVVSEGYGLTETSPVVSANPPEAIQSGTVGLPVIDTEVKVINEEGEALAQGQVGELCVRGPQVMKGYWQRPEETAAVLDEAGWFKTGDMALIQEDGYIRIVDRKKDMIIVSGFNVFPNEVEDIISEHEDVMEVGVIGIQDQQSGEAVKAYVVSKNPQLTTEALRAFCKENMAAYKVPRHVVFTGSLPKSAVGKILRRELKALDAGES